MSTPAERLREAREAAGFADAKAAARAFGWGYEAYKKHENGGAGIKAKVAVKYADAFGCTAEWLLFGSGSRSFRDRSSVNFRMLPLYSMSEVGMASARRNATAARKTPVDTGADIGPLAICIEIEDAAMQADGPTATDSFAPGDLVVIDPGKPARPGDFVLFEFAAGYAVLRRLRARAGGEYPFDLVPLNSAWAVETITSPDAGQVRGRVVRHIRIYA